MSFILLGILNSQASGGLSYWLATLGGASSDDCNSLSVDSSDNLYLSGTTSSVGAGGDLLLAKADTSGAIQWQRILGGSDYEESYGSAVDSSGNLFSVGISNSQGAGSFDVLLSKYNSSGVIQWQRVLGGASNDIGNSVAVDSSDNAYFVGNTSSEGAGFASLVLAKYNSSGTIQWQRVLGGTGSDSGSGVAVDSSDNIYVAGETTSEGEGNSDTLLAKYNSSGTIQWQRILGGTGAEPGKSVSFDSAGNVYLFGYTGSQGAGNRDFLLVKYNSSGTLQWQRILGGTGGDSGLSISFDSDDNAYVLGYSDSSGAGSNDFLFAKYNSSGTIQWQRTLGGTGSDLGKSVKIDSLNNLLISGRTASTGEGGNDVLFGKLPNDGSLTGTYSLDGVDIVYAASSLTAATSTLTAATSTLTSSTSTLTAATSTLTAASASLTSHLVEL